MSFVNILYFFLVRRKISSLFFRLGKVILTTEEVITATLNVISATAKVILAAEEVITATLKVISAIMKEIVATNKLLSAAEKNYLSHYNVSWHLKM